MCFNRVEYYVIHERISKHVYIVLKKISKPSNAFWTLIIMWNCCSCALAIIFRSVFPFFCFFHSFRAVFFCFFIFVFLVRLTECLWTEWARPTWMEMRSQSRKKNIIITTHWIDRRRAKVLSYQVVTNTSQQHRASIARRRRFPNVLVDYTVNLHISAVDMTKTTMQRRNKKIIIKWPFETK